MRINKNLKIIFVVLIVLLIVLLLFARRIYTYVSIAPKLKTLKNKNIIFITIDGLNSEIIENCRFENIDNFKNKGIYFKNCYTTSIQLLPSYISIFSSLYPFQHKIKDQLSGSIESPFYFMDILKKENYKSAAFISSAFLSSVFGLNKGYDFYYDKFNIEKNGKIKDLFMESNKITPQVINWLQTHYSDKFFVWVNYSDLISTKALTYKSDLSEFVKRYKLILGRVDNSIGKIVKFLKEEKLDKDTIIIITSPYSLPLKDKIYSAEMNLRTLRVPLIMDIPGVKVLNKRKILKKVSTIDIFPTILNFVSNADIDKKENIEGKNLIKTILFNKTVRDYILSEYYFSDMHFDGKPRISLIYSNYQYFKGQSGRLFNLKKRTMLKMKKASKIIHKFDKIIRKIYSRKIGEKIKINKLNYEIIKIFEKINYLPPIKNGKLKYSDNGVMEKYLLARKYFNKKLYSKAIKELKANKNSGKYFETIFLYAQIMERLGKPEKAIELFEKLGLNYPSNRLLLDKLTELYIKYNRTDKGIIFLKSLEDKTKIKAPVLSNLGDIYMSINDLNTAEKYYKDVLKYNPYGPEDFLKLGIIDFSKRKYDSAKDWILKAINLKKRVKNAYFYLGYLSEKEKEYKKALNYYKKELYNYPNNPELFFRLAFSYEAIGQPMKAIYYLKEYTKMSENDYLGYFELAKLYFLLKINLQETIPLILHSIQLCKDTKKLPSIYYLLSDIYKYWGDSKKSKYYYKLGKKIEKYGLTKSPIL
jgi:tetratricopeptide (TPR) repeat protein